MERTHEEYADYLERVGQDYRESGREATAEDYEESARRIRELAQAGEDAEPLKWERITAAQIEAGDRIARTRTEEPAEVLELEAPGASARYIRLRSGGRIRPRYTAKFWRVDEAEAKLIAGARGNDWAELEAPIRDNFRKLARAR